MSGRDGTGPIGQGSLTGRGLGPCSVRSDRALGVGFFRGIGGIFGRKGGYCFRNSYYTPRKGLNFWGETEKLEPENERSFLEEESHLLESRIDYIKKRLAEISKKKSD